VADGPPVYCIDTSALIDLWRRYPQKVFGGLWAAIEKLIEDGRLIAPREVLRDLQKGDDEVYKWAKKRAKMFVDLDAEQQALLKEVLKDFPKWVDPLSQLPEADPLVIALARAQAFIRLGPESSSATRYLEAPAQRRSPTPARNTPSHISSW
jgi:Domain of unknown function (DUF4411)